MFNSICEVLNEIPLINASTCISGRAKNRKSAWSGQWKDGRRISSSTSLSQIDNEVGSHIDGSVFQDYEFFVPDQNLHESVQTLLQFSQVVCPKGLAGPFDHVKRYPNRRPAGKTCCFIYERWTLRDRPLLILSEYGTLIQQFGVLRSVHFRKSLHPAWPEDSWAFLHARNRAVQSARVQWCTFLPFNWKQSFIFWWKEQKKFLWQARSLPDRVGILIMFFRHPHALQKIRKCRGDWITFVFPVFL